MYDECPQKYKLCYIDKVHIVEPISKTQTGTAIHNLINYYLKGMDVSKMVEALNSNEKNCGIISKIAIFPITNLLTVNMLLT